MNKKYKIALIIIGVLLVASTYIGVTYSLWVKTFEQSETNTITAGCFTLSFEELSNSINLKNTYPISDSGALSKSTPYKFKVTNTCRTTAAGYAITLNTVKVTGTKLDDSKVKVALGMNGVKPTSGDLLNTKEINTELENIQVSGTLLTSYIINTGFIAPNTSKTFDLYLWVNEGAGNEVMSQKFEAGVSITTYAAMMPTTMEETIKQITPVTTGTGLYSVGHSDAEITYTTDTTAINNLKQTELRYAGTNPNNYVTFNGEEAGWRIIGLVNTPEGQRIKLIKKDSIGSYAWDSSASSINSGYGVNEWSQADMMTLLNNGPYYNRTSGTCYNGSNNQTTSCNFSSNGLTTTVKNMIDTVTWNTGSNGNAAETSITTNQFYNYERSNNTGEYPDSVTRTTSWKGQVGLMYASDYGYATSGGTTTNRNTCLSASLNSSYGSECYNNNWLYNPTDYYEWILNPDSNIEYYSSVFAVSNSGSVHPKNMSMTSSTEYSATLPSLYLKSDVKMIGGNGSQSNPYELSL